MILQIYKDHYTSNLQVPPKRESRSSTIFAVEEAFLMLDEDPTDVLLAASGPPLFCPSNRGSSIAKGQVRNQTG